MYNIFYSLPNELIKNIYEYDPTYKEKFNDVLKFIDEMEICTCPHSSNCLCCSSMVVFRLTPLLRLLIVPLNIDITSLVVVLGGSDKVMLLNISLLLAVIGGAK